MSQHTQASPTRPYQRAAQRCRAGLKLLSLLARTAQRLNKPLLLVHGDSHDYYFDQPLRDAKGVVVPQLTRLEVPGSPRTEWVKVRAGAGKDAKTFWQATPFRAPD